MHPSASLGRAWSLIAGRTGTIFSRSAVRRASSVKSPADNHAGYNIGRPPFSDPIRSPARDSGCGRVVTGFFAYYAVPTNVDALAAFRYHVMMLWMRTLTRRSQKDRTGWDRINKLADQWVPKPRILHPWPNQRFAVKHPRWEPGAGMRHVRTYRKVKETVGKVTKSQAEGAAEKAAGKAQNAVGGAKGSVREERSNTEPLRRRTMPPQGFCGTASQATCHDPATAAPGYRVDDCRARPASIAMTYNAMSIHSLISGRRFNHIIFVLLDWNFSA